MLATQFSQKIRDAAARVLLKVQGITKKSIGLHLRMECDIFRDNKVVQKEQSYAEALSDLAFEPGKLVYVATGIFANGGDIPRRDQVIYDYMMYEFVLLKLKHRRMPSRFCSKKLTICHLFTSLCKEKGYISWYVIDAVMHCNCP